MPEREQMKKIDNVITLQEIPAQSIVSALSCLPNRSGISSPCIVVEIKFGKNYFLSFFIIACSE